MMPRSRYEARSTTAMWRIMQERIRTIEAMRKRIDELEAIVHNDVHNGTQSGKQQRVVI